MSDRNTKPFYEKLNDMGTNWICYSEENRAACENQYIKFMCCVADHYGSALGNVFKINVKMANDALERKSDEEDTSSEDKRKKNLDTAIADKVLVSSSKQEAFHDALIDVCMEVFRTYNPQKGELGAFFSSRLSLRKINRMKDYEDTSYGNSYNVKSLDEPINGNEDGGDKEQAFGDTIASFEQDPEQLLGAQLLNLELVSTVIQVKDSSKKKSPQKIAYFRMWLAEKTAYLAKSSPSLLLQGSEQRMFAAMDCGYLDYFTRADFLGTADYSFQRLINAELNPSDLKWNKDNWLPAGIPIGYMRQNGKTVYNSTISNERKVFLEVFKEAWECATGEKIR